MDKTVVSTHWRRSSILYYWTPIAHEQPLAARSAQSDHRTAEGTRLIHPIVISVSHVSLCCDRAVRSDSDSRSRPEPSFASSAAPRTSCSNDTFSIVIRSLVRISVMFGMGLAASGTTRDSCSTRTPPRQRMARTTAQPPRGAGWKARSCCGRYFAVLKRASIDKSPDAQIPHHSAVTVLQVVTVVYICAGEILEANQQPHALPRHEKHRVFPALVHVAFAN